MRPPFVTAKSKRLDRMDKIEQNSLQDSKLKGVNSSDATKITRKRAMMWKIGLVS